MTVRSTRPTPTEGRRHLALHLPAPYLGSGSELPEEPRLGLATFVAGNQKHCNTPPIDFCQMGGVQVMGDGRDRWRI